MNKLRVKIKVFAVLFLSINMLPSHHVLAQTNQNGSYNSVHSFVQAFYDWYVPIALQEDAPTPTFGIAIKRKQSDFGTILYSALNKDLRAQEKSSGFIVGLDFDPFLAAQDPCDHYVTGKITQNKEDYLVDVYGVCSGKKNDKPDVIAVLRNRAGGLVFVNFLYPGNGNLLELLKSLEMDRMKSKK